MFILVVLIGGYLLEVVVELLNVRNASEQLPAEFEGYYDTEKYRKSQQYLKDNTRFGLVSGVVSLVAIVVFILIGGFNMVDLAARSLNRGPIITGLVFAGILGALSEFLSIPFSIYHTFVLEEKYGFNRTTVKTFILDRLKGWALGIILGGLIFAGLIWFFGSFARWGWLYAWLGLTAFQLFLTFVAPVVIMPLFNKFTPLADGELKSSVEEYARSQDFKMKGLFTMDGSRRSTKSNAFFTGFGRFRRIVLFDTLIARHSVEELTSVLAHEMGHYKKGHIIKHMLTAVAVSAVMFFLLSLFINNPGLFAAFGMENLSIYASLIFFGFLYSPISSVLSVFSSIRSRAHEYEADAYAVTTYGRPEAMVTALKKLSVDNLSNLTPHPLKVFLEYSHPPVLKRIEAIRNIPAGKR